MKYLFLLLGLFSLNSLANSALPDNRHVSVVGTAKLQAKPDIAVISFEVKSFKQTSIEAKADVDTRVNNFLDGLSQFKIQQNNVSASHISTHPVYSYQHNDQKRLDGYEANRSLTVTLNQLKHLSELMNFALSVTINEIDSIKFKSSKEIELKDKVNALAVENAKEKGRSLAKAFGAELGKIYSINSNSQSHRYRYGANSDIERIEVTGSRIQSPGAGQYLQENIVYSASISVVFDLQVR